MAYLLLEVGAILKEVVETVYPVWIARLKLSMLGRLKLEIRSVRRTVGYLLVIHHFVLS